MSEQTSEVKGSSEGYPKDSVEEVRKILQSQLESHKDSWDLVHYEDLLRDDNLVRRYMRRRGGRVEQSAVFISSALQWRKEMTISELTDQSFPSEFYSANGMFVHGEDVSGNVVLYIRVAHTFNSPEIAPLLKKFIAYQMCKADLLAAMKGPEFGWVEVFECSNAGIRNADADLLGFINSSLKNYFPAGQKYILVVNLNWLLRAIKTLSFTWFPAAVKKRIHFCSDKEITVYIPKEKLPDYLGGPESAVEYKQVPKDCPSLDEMRKSGLIALDDEAYERGMKFIEKASA